MDRHNSSMGKWVKFLLGSCLVVWSCAPSLPVIQQDGLQLPERYMEDAPATPTTSLKDWTIFFPDQHLHQLIRTALAYNQELHVLEQEIQMASNEILARQGEYVPKLIGQGRLGLEKTSEWTSLGKMERDLKLPDPISAGHLGLLSSWEVDIWQKLRNAAKSAYYDYLASMESRQWLTTRLVAETAQTYFELLAIDNQLMVVRQFTSILQEIKTMVEYQQTAARVTSLAVKRFEAEIAKNQARQYQLQQRQVELENSLHVRRGRMPQAVARDANLFLQLTFEPLESGVPAALLDNRPDVKSTLFALESAKLHVASVKARFYPGLSIEAGAGLQSFRASEFFSIPQALLYGLGGQLTAPLLNRAAIEADYLTANNQQIQAVYQYEQTLLKAYLEVVNQLNGIANTNQALAHKQQQFSILQEAVDISQMLFQNARVDYVEALLTQRDALETQLELIETKQQQLSAYVRLYQALGGGWQPATDGAKPSTPP